MSSTIGVCILANVLIILSSIFSFGCINSALPLPALANCFIKYEFTFESIPNGNILLFFPCSFTKSIICFSFPTWPSVNSNITFWDVYVALNAQYHDNIELYKEWFGEDNIENIKDKIIESAIVNWFEDEDAGSL